MAESYTKPLKGKAGQFGSTDPSPDKTPHTKHAPPRAGFFIAMEPWRHRLPRKPSPIRHSLLSHSPEAHQTFTVFAPELCRWVHQRGCDFEGVEGATPPHQLSLLKTMTNNTSTFTPSTQILEAAEQAQALADAGKPIARFLSPEIQETVDGVQKISNALNATGEALRHFGFDESEPETFSQISGQDFDAEVDTNGDESVGVAWVPAVVAGAKVIAPIVAKGVVAGTIAYVYSKNFGDEMEPDAADSLTGENVQAGAFDELGDEEVGIGPALPVAVVVGGGAAKITAGAVAAGKFIGSAAAVGGVAYGVKKGWEKIFGDEMEPDVAEGSAYQGEFSSNPETLAPIDFNSSVVTDAYQQQKDPGADLIGGPTNQRTDSYQAQENQYAVLA